METHVATRRDRGRLPGRLRLFGTVADAPASAAHAAPLRRAASGGVMSGQILPCVIPTQDLRQPVILFDHTAKVKTRVCDHSVC